VLRIALEVAEGEWEFARGEHDKAYAHLHKAIEIESELFYDEPPSWHHPVRQILGTLLLEGGRPAEAEQAFRDDLAKYPDNGWSLFGLMQALDAQGRTQEAAKIRAQFQEAWKRAEIELTQARI
jgi:tetratricopeptide (TPR) repeat protein